MARAKTNLFGNLSGKAGNVVFMNTKHGVVVRPYVVPHDPKTPAQLAFRQRMTLATAAYHALTPAQRDVWRTYALSLVPPNNAGDDAPPPTAYNTYITLALSYLRVHPNGTPPVSPPVRPFVGDIITLTAAGQSGQVVFAASAPNAANVTTELLLQPLKTSARTPIAERYRHEAFATFAAGSLTASVPAARGAYAPAYKFVNTVTGQTVALVPLPMVVVS